MNMEMIFYKCPVCGQIITVVKGTKVPVMCCGKPMQKIEAGVVDAAAEKHVPVAVRNGNILEVTVGSVMHPMADDHYIEWIAVQTNQGNQMKALKPGMEPKAVFALSDGEEVTEVYAYCNLHSLWKA